MIFQVIRPSDHVRVENFPYKKLLSTPADRDSKMFCLPRIFFRSICIRVEWISSLNERATMQNPQISSNSSTDVLVFSSKYFTDIYIYR